MNETFMKEKPVFPLILSMAIPMVVSMLVNSLYNIVDSFFVAQISEDAMTALSLVYPVQNFLNAVSIGFGVGLNAVIAFYLGAGDYKKADMAASQGITLSVVHSVILTIGSIAVMPVFLGMFTSSASILELGLQYSRIAFAFTPVIIFNLIFGLGPFPVMGIHGAALATGMGQALTQIYYLTVYIRRPIQVRIRRSCLRLTRQMAARLYAIGIPATLNLALPSVLISALNGILAAYSGVYILVLGIYYKLQTFLYLPANGFVQAMRPLIGYNYGAGEHKRVSQIYRIVLAMTSGIMLAGMVICLVIPGWLMGLFTHTPETVAAGETALRVISAGFLVSSVSVTSSGALEGLGKGTPSLIISLCRYLVLIIPAAFVLSRIFGPVGVWNAFWVAEAATALVSLVVYRRALHRA